MSADTPSQLRAYADNLRKLADEICIDAARIESEQPQWRLYSVRIINRDGLLSGKNYSYRYQGELTKGTLVIVPTTEPWQPVVSHAIVQGLGDKEDDISWYEEIERVVS